MYSIVPQKLTNVSKYLYKHHLIGQLAESLCNELLSFQRPKDQTKCIPFLGATYLL